MQPPEDVKQRLASEFRFAADQLAATPVLGRKLYFWSVFYAEALRAFNLWWHSDLVLLHHVVQAAYQTMNARVSQVQTGADRVVGLLPEFSDALNEISAELAAIFEEQEIDSLRLHNALARIAVVSYSTVGNGHYLYLKGELKL